MGYYRKFSVNHEGNDYICPDIHGCFGVLEETLKKIKFNKQTDRLFVLGDLIDRGPLNEQVLQYLDEKWFFSILGNHDLLCVWSEFYTYWQQVWFNNKGGWIHDKLKPGELRILRDKLSLLPLIIEIENKEGKKVGLVHAEVYPNQKWEDLVHRADQMTLDDLQRAGGEYNKYSLFVEQLVWSRSKIEVFKKGNNNLDQNVEGVDFIFHGHTIVKKDVQIGNCYYIDKGCFKTETLNIIDINQI